MTRFALLDSNGARVGTVALKDGQVAVECADPDLRSRLLVHLAVEVPGIDAPTPPSGSEEHLRMRCADLWRLGLRALVDAER